MSSETNATSVAPGSGVALPECIAEVLAAHRGRSDENGPPEQLCECGFTSDYIISDEFYDAVTWPTEDALETAAFERVGHEMEAHQAERIANRLREYLGKWVED